MMFKKLVILLASATMPLMGSFAQTVVKYDYDNAGNRTYRGIIVLETIEKKGYIDTLASKPKVVEDKLGEQVIKIYPNPTRGILKLEVQGYTPEEKSYVSIYSIKGKHLQTKEFNSPEVTLDLTNYPLGTYILRITLGKNTSEWKILKE